MPVANIGKSSGHHIFIATDAHVNWIRVLPVWNMSCPHCAFQIQQPAATVINTHWKQVLWSMKHQLTCEWQKYFSNQLCNKHLLKYLVKLLQHCNNLLKHFNILNAAININTYCSTVSHIVNWLTFRVYDMSCTYIQHILHILTPRKPAHTQFLN